jgi:hypothetical protein
MHVLRIHYKAGKKVSKLYIYSIQSIMSEHEKKIRSFTS